MKPLLFAVAMCLLSGCDSKYWPNAAETHACSDEQMEKAQREAAWCNDNTDYLKESQFRDGRRRLASWRAVFLKRNRAILTRETPVY